MNAAPELSLWCLTYTTIHKKITWTFQHQKMNTLTKTIKTRRTLAELKVLIKSLSGKYQNNSKRYAITFESESLLVFVRKYKSGRGDQYQRKFLLRTKKGEANSIELTAEYQNIQIFYVIIGAVFLLFAVGASIAIGNIFAFSFASIPSIALFAIASREPMAGHKIVAAEFEEIIALCK